MNSTENKQVDISIEDIDLARRLYRRLVLNFVLIGMGGLAAGMYLLLYPLPGVSSIGGFDIGEWVVMITLIVIMLLLWSQTYKICRILKNYTALYMVIAFPIMIFMIQVAIAQAAQRAGYRIGPFLGSLRPIEK